MKYFISAINIDWSWNRYEQHGQHNPKWLQNYFEKERNKPPYKVDIPYPTEYKGQIVMYDRNQRNFQFFKIVKKDEKQFGYIVERNRRPSEYWKTIIKEIKDD